MVNTEWWSVTRHRGVSLVACHSFWGQYHWPCHEILIMVKCFHYRLDGDQCSTFFGEGGADYERWRVGVSAGSSLLRGETQISLCVCVCVCVDTLNVVILPSSLTTSGTFNSNSRQALVMPLAMMAQLTMPPKMLTRMASTCEWGKTIKTKR